MRLLELFDKPAKSWKKTPGGNKFFIDDDGPYTVHFMPADSENFTPDENVIEWIDSQFPNHTPMIDYLVFYYKMSADITGIGQPYKVFSTVLMIARQHIAANNLDFMVFAAKEIEPSRVKLYRRMAKILGTDYRSYYAGEGEIQFVVKVS